MVLAGMQLPMLVSWAPRVGVIAYPALDPIACEESVKSVTGLPCEIQTSRSEASCTTGSVERRWLKGMPPAIGGGMNTPGSSEVMIW